MHMTEAINKLLAHARDEILQNGYRVDSCICSTRVAVDVLRRLGHQCEPQPASVVVYNKAMTDLILKLQRLPKGPAEFDQWTEEYGAYSVGAGLRLPTGIGFVCHLVAIVNRQVLVDLSLDQLSRPEWGLQLDPFADEFPVEFLEGKPFITNLDGMLMIYRKSHEENWKLSPDWVDQRRYGPVVEAVLRRIKG
jgi:hypothetical protein